MEGSPQDAENWLQHGDVDGMAAGLPPVSAALVTSTPVLPPAVPPPTGRQIHGKLPIRG